MSACLCQCVLFNLPLVLSATAAAAAVVAAFADVTLLTNHIFAS